MADAPIARPFIEPLGAHHDREAFSCGVQALDAYFQRQAGQDARRLIAAPFVLVMPEGSIGGYYTLAATAISLSDLPAYTVRRLPRYPLVPAFLIGRLAVDLRYQGQGWGRFLLADALRRCVNNEIPGFAVVVDAKDDNARSFYERESFLPLPETPNRLFRRLADIADLMREVEPDS